jgi:hypothetical protein
MSVIACHQCGEQINSRLRTCPHCQAPQPSSLLTKLAVLGLIAICLAATAYAIAHNRRAAFNIGSNIPLDPSLSADAQIQTMAELFVKRVLQSPSTANFAPPAEWQTSPIDKSTSRMRAWVDSENASGKTLRAHFSIAIKLSSDSASLLYLQFDDDDKPLFGVRPLTEAEKKFAPEKN